MLVAEKINEVYLQINNLEYSQSLELKSFLSCYMTNYMFHPKVKAKLWDGKISFFDWRNKTIPIGLLPKFIKFCKIFNYKYTFNFDTNELHNKIEKKDLQNFYKMIFNDKFYPRDYQHETINKSLCNKRGVIEAATSSGKTLVQYAIIRFLLTGCEGKILLIVPNISLVNQMYSDWQEYGWENCHEHVSKIFHKSDKVDWSCPIIISTWQSLQRKSNSFFEQFQAVLCDEVHLAKGKTINSILKKCTNAEYRLGFTGTMPDEKDYQMTIYGYLGPKIFTLKSKELIDKGVLSKIKIANLLIKYPQKVINRYWYNDDGKVQQMDYQEELDLIYSNQERNNVLKYIIDRFNKKDNYLVLCHKIDHLKQIKRYLDSQYPDRGIYEFYGKTDPKDREKIRKLTNEKGGIIICGTFATLSTGLNIKRLHHVIFASSFKSKISILQSIGRGLRKHETKNQVIIWDLIDDLTRINGRGNLSTNHVYSHWQQRVGYYKEQQFKYFNKEIRLDEI